MEELRVMAGLALAGGRSARFGSEKAAARLGGRTLLRVALDHLGRDCGPVAVSAVQGSQAERMATQARVAVLHDAPGSPRGPLSGICAGLAWARERGCTLLATLPCDVPLAPEDLFVRLRDALRGEDGAAVARTPDGLQSLCVVLRAELHAPLAALLSRNEHPPVHEWLADVRAREVAFDDGALFRNVNTKEDLAAISAAR